MARLFTSDPSTEGDFSLHDADEGFIGKYDGTKLFGSSKTCSLVTSTRWYAASFKFDLGFPTNHYDLGSGSIIQFSDSPSALYPASISFGWPNKEKSNNFGFRSGYWHLIHTQFDNAAQIIKTVSLYEFSFDLGKWHDIKLQVRWAQDTGGLIRLWHNGERKTFSTGLDTHYGPNVPPSLENKEVTGVQAQWGYKSGTSAAGIVYTTGFRIADDESSL